MSYCITPQSTWSTLVKQKHVLWQRKLMYGPYYCDYLALLPFQENIALKIMQLGDIAASKL